MTAITAATLNDNVLYHSLFLDRQKRPVQTPGRCTLTQNFGLFRRKLRFRPHRESLLCEWLKIQNPGFGVRNQ